MPFWVFDFLEGFGFGFGFLVVEVVVGDFFRRVGFGGSGELLGKPLMEAWIRFSLWSFLGLCVEMKQLGEIMK